MSDQTSGSRWLIVVRPEQAELYQNLREAFAEVPDVAVTLDRRHRERRGRDREADAAADRRRIQRRGPIPVADHDLWERAGFRLIHRAEDLQVFEAQEPPDR